MRRIMTKIRKINNNRKLRYFPPGMMGIVVLALIAGCAGTYGSLKRDAEVQQAFESNQVPKEFKYYYYGFDTRQLKPMLREGFTTPDNVPPKDLFF
jgi:hypothetical protein